MAYTGRKPPLRAADYYVDDADFSAARAMVAQHHYAKGGSNTFVYLHGLFERTSGRLVGVAWWLPPTRVACESVNRENWKRVLALTRLVILPDVPGNAASYLLSRSVKRIADEGRFVSLVTYACESQGHTGTIYRASGWTYIGVTGPYTRWVSEDGRQVACKATVNRTVKAMEDLGYVKCGPFHKHKYVMHLDSHR